MARIAPTLEHDVEQEVVPAELVYEMAERPIYFREYRAVLRRDKQVEEVMGSSYLQAHVIMAILRHLLTALPPTYRVLTNEVGLRLALNQWRAVDIAVYRPGQLEKVPLTNEYLIVAPAVVVEVDTKADLSTFSSPMDYYVSKTQALLDFGVERVIWVFTDARRTLVAAAGEDWTVQPWAGAIPVLDWSGLSLAELVAG